MPPREAELLPGTLDLLILKAVSLGQLHGYGILVRIGQISGAALNIEQGALYPALYRLETKGFLAAEWGVSDNNRRAKFYTLTDMKEEAAKAQAIGCEALYLDPGWDTRFASKIWDASRLGPLEDFTALLRRDYNLSLSLHTPLSGWCNPRMYPREMDRMNRDGSITAERSADRRPSTRKLRHGCVDDALFAVSNAFRIFVGVLIFILVVSRLDRRDSRLTANTEPVERPACRPFVQPRQHNHVSRQLL